MKEFGVKESWTQFLKTSYHNLQIGDHVYVDFYMVPLCLSEENDTLLLRNNRENQAILYNWRDSRAERVQNFSRSNARVYVESLVSFC
jgi:hypothetical protein